MSGHRVVITRAVAERIREVVRTRTYGHGETMLGAEHEARREVMYCASRALAHHRDARTPIRLSVAGVEMVVRYHGPTGRWMVGLAS